MKKILIVNDCKTANNMNYDILKLNEEKYEIIIKTDKESTLNYIKQYHDFQLIVVNVVLPEVDSLEFCRQIQHTVRCPIIYTPTKNSSLNNILGLEMCKNDYIFKPLLMENLVGRITSHIKEEQSKAEDVDTLTFGPFKVKTISSEVFKDEQKIDLSPLEYKLLLFFISNKEKVLTNDQLINCVWGIAYGNNDMLRVAIRRLRIKIDPYNEYLITRRSKGYKLTIPIK